MGHVGGFLGLLVRYRARATGIDPERKCEEKFRRFYCLCRFKLKVEYIFNLDGREDLMQNLVRHTRRESTSYFFNIFKIYHVSNLAGLGAHESFVIVHPVFWIKPWQCRFFAHPPLFHETIPRGVILSLLVRQRVLNSSASGGAGRSSAIPEPGGKTLDCRQNTEPDILPKHFLYGDIQIPQD